MSDKTKFPEKQRTTCKSCKSTTGGHTKACQFNPNNIKPEPSSPDNKDGIDSWTADGRPEPMIYPGLSTIGNYSWAELAKLEEKNRKLEVEWAAWHAKQDQAVPNPATKHRVAEDPTAKHVAIKKPTAEGADTDDSGNVAEGEEDSEWESFVN